MPDGGPLGQVEGGFGECQPDEVAELDEAGLDRACGGEPVQCLVDGEQVFVGLEVAAASG